MGGTAADRGPPELQFPTLLRCLTEHIGFAYQNKAVLYDILFRATAKTLMTIEPASNISVEPSQSFSLRGHCGCGGDDRKLVPSLIIHGQTNEAQRFHTITLKNDVFIL
jgi:hypothetical protein